MHDGPKLPAAAEIRSYGRRHGRKFSPRQAALLRDELPKISLDLTAPAPRPLGLLFDRAVADVWLEIGFGGGEHLVWQAEHNPNVGLVGCEPFLDGVVKMLSSIEQHGLRNVRIHAHDARDVLRWLPDASLARVFILFPDPWPKKRHRKRRLVSHDLLSGLARVVKTGGELRMATDIGDYARTALSCVRQASEFEWLAKGPGDWRQRPPDWPPTRYEAKALHARRVRFV